MPVDLTKISTVTSTKTKSLNVSYFHPNLTGNGGKVGVFDQAENIVSDNIATHLSKAGIVDIDFSGKSRAVVHDGFITPSVPAGLIEDKRHTFVLSAFSMIADLATTSKTKFYKLPHYLSDIPTTEITKNDKVTVTSGVIFDRVDYRQYRSPKDADKKPELYTMHGSLVVNIIVPDAKITDVYIVQQETRLPHINTKKHNVTVIMPEIDIYQAHVGQSFELHNDLNDLNRYIANTFNTDPAIDLANKMLDMVEATDVVKTLKNQAKINQKHLLEDLPLDFKFANGLPDQFKLHRQILTHAYHLIKLDEDSYTENDYQYFYNRVAFQTIKHHTKTRALRYTPFSFSKLISVNTRLSLTHQISKMAKNPRVYQFVPTSAKLTTTEKYSPEQEAIILTTEPYCVGIAGAGSGKSHTLLGRLAYLRQNGVDFKHVLVTSFTNTAAKNIITRFQGGINSLTNANLFHKIYQRNFDHELTNDLTIGNILEMMSGTSKLMTSNSTINDTRLSLASLIKKSVNNGFQKVDPRKITEDLIALINEHLDDTIKILDSVKQTSLLLEPIIINALMQNQAMIHYPAELQNLNFIITDESQDTSAFEYVLLLQLAQINDAQIMIIGDANQTLYEFRNANPDFLNALERSDAFKTYTMSTNYRSEQSVLTMANQFLDVLKTNATAKLQLHANKYTNVDEASFKSDIQLQNLILEPGSKKAIDLKTELIQNLTKRQDFTDWVIDQYHNKNQIAVMAYRNADTKAIGEAVSQILNTQLGITATVGYTRQPTPRPNTWLSQMLSETHDAKLTSKLKSGHVTVGDVEQSLMGRLQALANRRKYNQGIINQWAIEKVHELLSRSSFKANLKDLNAHRISPSRFNGFINLWLIKAETTKNNVSRLMQDTQSTDWQDCDIVISTIHSAKGLEFDSVICYFDETMRSATTQENLRLYGVALTRAKEKELILNRPKLDRRGGTPVPSSFAYEQSDMFKTPMRTAYARVIQEIRQQATAAITNP